MVHPGGLLALRLALRALLKQRYPPWCLRLLPPPLPSFIAEGTENMVHPGGFEPPTLGS